MTSVVNNATALQIEAMRKQSLTVNDWRWKKRGISLPKAVTMLTTSRVASIGLE